jgi:hypothetical protein
MAAPEYECEFDAALFRYAGDGGWLFAVVPPEHAPARVLGWGRTPVRATVDGRPWETSVWREKSGRTLLAVPKKIRGAKDDLDEVRVSLSYSIIYRD